METKGGRKMELLGWAALGFAIGFAFNFLIDLIRRKK